MIIMEMLRMYKDQEDGISSEESSEHEEHRKTEQTRDIINNPKEEQKSAVSKSSEEPSEDQISAVSQNPPGEKIDDKSEDKQNYFGSTSSDSESDSETVSELLRPKRAGRFANDPSISKYFKKALSDGPEVPQSSFWKGHDADVDWSRPEQIWKQDSSVDVSQQSSQRFPAKSNYQSSFSSQPSSSNIPKNFSEHSNMRLAKSCFFIHHKTGPLLHQAPSRQNSNFRTPKKRILELEGHAGAVNRIQWNIPNFSHLLLSASMDQTVKVWNTMSDIKTHVQTLSFHNKSVKDAKWSHDGRQILSCGYDKTSRLLDVENGRCVHSFAEDSFVTCVQYHPVNYHLFVSGSTNLLSLWDCRKPGKPARLFKYKDVFGQVQDLAFVPSGSEIFSCNDLVSRDSSDRNVMAWDFLKAVVVSTQMYQERYTCSRLLVHRSERHLLAQSQGNYVAQFSTIRPFRMNKNKRFEGHKVSGYNIGLDLSPDGHTLATGSSDGRVCFYDYSTSRSLGAVTFGRDQVCMDVVWHPLMSSRVAVATWGGGVSVWT